MTPVQGRNLTFKCKKNKNYNKVFLTPHETYIYTQGLFIDVP